MPECVEGNTPVGVEVLQSPKRECVAPLHTQFAQTGASPEGIRQHFAPRSAWRSGAPCPDVCVEDAAGSARPEPHGHGVAILGRRPAGTCSTLTRSRTSADGIFHPWWGSSACRTRGASRVGEDPADGEREAVELHVHEQCRTVG